jgi:hypothetical protein
MELSLTAKDIKNQKETVDKTMSNAENHLKFCVDRASVLANRVRQATMHLPQV